MPDKKRDDTRKYELPLLGAVPDPPDDESPGKLTHLFAEGAWVPSADPLVIGAQNFPAMQNLRFGKGQLEGVPGYSKINPTALVDYPKIRAGIQLRTPYQTASRLLVQAYNDGETAAAILQNTTGPPAQGDFAGTPLHTDAAGAGRGRFARWPNHQVAYCNGVESKIYGGDEIPAAALLTSTAAVTGSALTNAKDYSAQVRNTLQTADQVAIIGGGNDAYTMALLNFEALDGANVADSSVGGAGAHDAALVGTAELSDWWAKFGAQSGRLPAHTDAFSITNHADLNLAGTPGCIETWILQNGLDNLQLQAYGSYTYTAATKTITRVSGNDFSDFSVGDSIVCHGPVSGLHVAQIVTIAGDKNSLTIDDADGMGDGASLYLIYGVLTIFGRYADANNYWYVGQVAQWGSLTRIVYRQCIAGVITSAKSTNCSYAVYLTGAHYALSHNGTGTLLVFVDGVAYTLSGITGIPDIAGDLRIGSCQNAAATYTRGWGYHDEFRLSKGKQRYTTDFTPRAGPFSTAGRFILAGFTRPVAGGKFYIASGGENDTPSTLSLQEWNRQSWASKTLLTDGTTEGGCALAQTGSWTCASTVETSVPKYIRGRVLYWYQFELSDGEAEVYMVTGNAPFQDVRDCWAGAEIPLAACLFYDASDSHWIDYTAQAADSTETTPIILDAMQTGDCLLCGSPVELMAVKVYMSADVANINTNAATTAVGYCNGDTSPATWPNVTGLDDQTTDQAGSIPLQQTGVVSFSPVPPGQAYQYAVAGSSQLYFYKISFSAALSATARPYHITGIPAPKKILPYRFPFMFRGRAMLCGYPAGNEGNRVDFPMANSTEGWNGPDSSFGMDNSPLYIGGAEDLTAACEVYNRLGPSIYTFALFFKARETHLLNGYDPETYQQLPVDTQIGCPAPETLDTWTYGVSEDGAAVRSIAQWLSYQGPVRFDSGGLQIIPGLECYFDAEDPRCINFAAIANSVGWFAPNGDYHLQFPSGAGQTENNVWVACTADQRKWYPVVPSAAASPYLGVVIPVADADGKTHVYGARDNGYVMRLHHGVTFDGTAQVQSVTLADLLVAGDPWIQIRLDLFKIFGVATTEDIDAQITHYADGAPSGTALADVPMQNAAGRYFKHTQPVDIPAWSHQIVIAATVTEETKGLKLLGWGMQYHMEREDTVDG